MPIHPDRLSEIATHPLKRGSHESMAAGMCALEAVSYVAGEPWSDHPECACPVIAAFLRSWNDGLPFDRDRNRLLKPLIPRVVGSRSSTAVEERRAWMALDWLVRENTPAWLELAGLTDHARALRDLAELVDAESLAASAAMAARAASDASDARDAWDAWDASAAWATWAARDAWDASAARAANDASAAWDARVAMVASVARVARVASVASAAWAAWDASDAGWAAASAAAGAALQPTVERLQESALTLIDRMLAVSDTEVA